MIDQNSFCFPQDPEKLEKRKKEIFKRVFRPNFHENILDQIGRMKLSAALIGSTMAVDRPEPVTETGTEPEGTKRPFKNIHIKDDMFYSPAHLNHLERQV